MANRFDLTVIGDGVAGDSVVRPGAQILAAHGGDLINEIALAMQTRLSVRQLAGTIHAYPTPPESLRWWATSFLGE